ncbi:hypothetical protein ACWD4F_37280 [Streptomyces aureus]
MAREARDGGVESSGTPDRVRFRASWRQSLPLSLVLGASVLMQLSNPLLWGHEGAGSLGLPSGLRVLSLVMVFLVLFELWVLGRYVGVTLTREAVVVHNLRRRTIPWTAVAEVAVEPVFGGRRVVLYETDGRRTPLRMPSTAFLASDRRFDDKVATIRSRWLAAGGVSALAATAGESGAWGHTEGVSGAWGHTDGEPGSWGHTGGRAPGRLVMRPAPSRSVPTALLLGWLAADALIMGFADGPGHALSTLLARVLGVLVATALLFGAGLLSLGRGVVLTADHLAVRGPRPRTIPWDRIRGIAVEPYRGGRRTVVVEADGLRTPLPVPRVGRVLWDSEFEARVRTLRQWQHAHAGTDPSPAEAAPQPDDQGGLLPYRGPRMWQKAVLTLACAVLGYEIFVSLLVGSLFLTVGQ